MLLRQGNGGEHGLMVELKVVHYKQLLKESLTHLMNFKPHSFSSTIYCTPMINFAAHHSMRGCASPDHARFVAAGFLMLTAKFQMSGNGELK